MKKKLGDSENKEKVMWLMVYKSEVKAEETISGNVA